MRKFISAAVVVLGLSAVASASFAQDASAPAGGQRGARFAEKAQEKFKAADTNGDGMISKDEAAKGLPRVSEHFDEIDTNHDGQLSPDELKAWMESKRGSHKGAAAAN